MKTCGVYSVTLRGSILWNTLTDDRKTFTNIAAFKKIVIGWKGESGSCNYVDEVLFFAIFFFLFLSHEYLSN